MMGSQLELVDVRLLSRQLHRVGWSLWNNRDAVSAQKNLRFLLKRTGELENDVSVWRIGLSFILRRWSHSQGLL